MAKLTAKFNIEDRITRKLRSIRGEFVAVEKTRKNLDKPMVIRVRDQATRNLRRLHTFVRKDIAKTHELLVTLKDRASKPLNRINAFVKNKMPRTHDFIVRAQDRTRTVLERIRGYTRRHLAKPTYLFLEAKDRAMPVLHRVANYAKRQLSRGYSFTVKAIDVATTTVGRIASFASTAIPRYRNFTIRAFDRASRIIGTVKRALFSIPTAITVALAVVGVNKLKDATVGSAMNFEGYQVSMDHWLDGNTKASKELVTWMGQFADKTPFSSPDLFPALARGVGLAGGDVSEAKRLLTIATNMAALTPGRTVEDAMEALGGAQMGEFQMLKGYNIQMSADEYEAIGGWEALLTEIDGKFAGGAEKLSETAQGILATLAGYRGSILRSLGEGFLEPMKPRLNAISNWLDNNQETWGRWKKTVQQVGEDASEWVFSKLENGFTHIKTNYLENDDFKKLDFEGKVKFIMSDLKQWWDKTGSPLLQDVGIKFGKAIGEGMIWGFKEGLKGVAGMWLNAFKDPSLSNFAGAGIATALAGSVLSLILTPLFRGISGIFKTGKWFWDQGKKVAGLFGKGKGRGTPPPAPRSGGRSRGGGWFSNLFGKDKKPDYRHPWFNKGAKPDLNTPNQDKIKPPKIPKGLSKLANFGKRIPVLGTLLGGLALATAPKEDKAGVAGGIGGGLVGATAGAAIGSVVPVIGTTIGGILGGVLGSIGGTAIGDWFSDNWSSIKQGAVGAALWVFDVWNNTWSAVKDFGINAGQWISSKFNEGADFIKEKWSDFSGWFSEAVWTPISDAAINTMNFFVGLWDIGREWIAEKWGDFSEWFDETIWEPVKEGVAITSQWVSDRWTEAKEMVSETWEVVSEWFDETVWEPIRESAEVTGAWISERYDIAKEWISETWSAFSGWFEEVVWTPVKEGAEVTGQWISDRYTEAEEWVTEIWGAISGWFDETVWGPIKDGAEIAGSWIGEQFDNAVSLAKDAWDGLSGWFDNNVWDPVKKGAQEAWGWIKGKWNEATTWAGEITQRGEGVTGVSPTKKYADGGIINRPHLGLVGEAGPEAIIPLSANRRSRALSLYERTGRMLGVKPFASGGVVGVANLPQEQVSSVISVTTKDGSRRDGKGYEININFNGDSYYSDEMDAEKVADIAVKAIEKKLEDEYFESGELVIDL